jgi:uncharacterized caspase-like protein
MNKIALVYGNGSYPESSLKNPANDAKSIKEKLTKLGFRCITRTDAKVKEMEIGLVEFSELLEDNDVGLFFFAGHGMQIDGRNYLTAIDTDFSSEVDAKYSSLPLDKVIDVMDSGDAPTKIIILDACRNNPYERRWRSSDTRGLAPIFAPKGMIIAYATSPGQVALDGDGANGAYTKALLHHISTQDITIEDLFKRVRNTLSSSTKGHQISWEHTSLMGDFYFNYSMVTDELITEYSKNALSDSLYRPSDRSVHDIIESLKSYNWYAQNPAIQKLGSLKFEKVEKDDLLVLGRNVYQAACGSANSAIDFLNNLDIELSRMESKTAFHILNGMLFEIYFDGNGRRRKSGKADMIDQVFSLEANKTYSASFEFIQQALKPYTKELFYIPGQRKDVCIDITTHRMKDGKRAISGLFFEGDNILYDERGESYFDPTVEDSFFTTKKQDEINKLLSQCLITPNYRLKITYVDIDEPDISLLFPFPPKILRFSKD